MDNLLKGILNEIDDKRNGVRNIGLGAIKWLLCHERNCDATSLLAAVCYDVKVDPETFDPGGKTYAKLSLDVGIPTILRACSNLVEYKNDAWGPTFHFIHLAVRDYLIEQNWMPEARACVAERCLHHLLDLHSPIRSTFYSFTSYAQHAWALHLQQADKDGPISPTLLTLLKVLIGEPGVLSRYIESQANRSIYWDPATLDLCAFSPPARVFNIYYKDSVFKEHFLCVVFYLGLERTFLSLLSTGSEGWDDFPTSLFALTDPSDKQIGFALSLATTPNMVRKYISFLKSKDHTTGDILWQLLANCKSHSHEYILEEDIRPYFIDTIANYIIKYAVVDEQPKLLGATINLVLGSWSGIQGENIAWDRSRALYVMKGLVKAGARPLPYSFENPPGYRWLSTIDELFGHRNDDYVECAYTKEMLSILPPGGANPTADDLSRIIGRFSTNLAGTYGGGGFILAQRTMMWWLAS